MKMNQKPFTMLIEERKKLYEIIDELQKENKKLREENKMFKKKEKPEEVDAEPIQSDAQEKEQKIDPEVKQVVDEFLKKYDGVFVPQTFAGVRAEATIVNIQLAILGELKKLNKAIKEEDDTKTTA